MLLTAKAAIVVLGMWLPIVSAISGFVVPWLTELVTKQIAPGLLRTAILTLLSAVGGAVSIIIANNGTFALVPTLIAMIETWVVALTVQSHFTNNAVSSAPLLKLRVQTAAFGIGPKASPAQEAA